MEQASKLNTVEEIKALAEENDEKHTRQQTEYASQWGKIES